jgi:hypothetical protein
VKGREGGNEVESRSTALTPEHKPINDKKYST